MKTRAAITIVLASLATLLVCADVQAAPRNIIFFIGDGMGPEQVKAAAIYAYGAPETMLFESFPYQGELTTYSANSSITDSAAAATALATSFKVNNGVISMAGVSELETLLEYSKSLGKSTGLVTTTYVEHATPAAFGAHEPSRDNYTQIANDYLTQTQPNILFGGCAYTSGADGYGYVEVFDRAGMQALDPETVDRVSGQFGSSYMPYEYDGLGSLPHLSEMTATALDILDKDADGFFLMIEGGMIDQACHSNDLIRSIYETIEFADAVQVAIEWAAGRSDTLILVTADHECGGLAVTANNGAGILPSVTWSTTGHTAANVPVYAWGVNAELISGVMDNTEMFGVVVADQAVADNPSPADAEVGVSPVSLSLSATVYNPSGTTDPADVEFFGREEPTFSIVVLPDTQKYVNVVNGGNPDIFTSQTQWIADNASSMNIVFVTHEGDITDSTDRPAGMDVPPEWERANTSMSLLDSIVPYGLLPGNHDKPTTYFNTYFPYTRYDSEPWYGDHYPSAGNDNSYQLFSAGGDDYIILHIEYNPDSSVTAWASSVLATYSDRKAIITTHSYLNTDGSLTADGGSAIWNNIVTPNDNVFFVLCGHNSGERYQLSAVESREVHQLLCDYQDRANGGDGWLRIMTFDPDVNEVHVQTYSPWLDQYEADGDSGFVLSFDMTSAGYSLIGGDLGVTSGEIATTSWPGLSMETQYQWYVTVEDTVTHTVIPGSLWSFTTASLKASNPNPANGATDVDVDADLSWSPGVDAVSHDVYFGADFGAVSNADTTSTEFKGNQVETTYDPGTLQQGLTYYWAIDERDSIGGVTAGDIWSFTTTAPRPEVIVAAGSTWKYDDTNTDWYSQGWPSIDDSTWSSGTAPLGFGDPHIVTSLMMGTPRYPSYYFRHSFTVTKVYQSLTLKVLRDDGCVVYLNGTEVAKSNMPDTTITHTTLSASTVGGADETNYFEFSVDPALLTMGTNVLAVDVHQCNSTSSDLGFDLELLAVVAPGQPVANDDSDTTDEDMPVTIGVLANDTDPDNDPLVVESVTQPANGTVVNNGTDVTYTPDENFNGVDSFTYTATDGTSSSNSATVTITVNPINDAPVADDQAISTRQSTPVDITLTGSDVDGDPLTYSVVTGPTNGTLNGTEPDLIYTPNTGYTGPDSFTFKANDATVDSDLATVTITVNANNAPVANPDSYSIEEDGTLNVDAASGVLFNDTDADGDSLTAVPVSNVTQGVLTLNPDGSFTYTPNANVNGSDIFTYKANDGTADSTPTTVSITITPVNDDPVANDDPATTDEDTPTTINVLGNDTDVDGDSLSVISVTQPANGSVVNNGSDVTYTPNANFFGSDSFTYTAGDGNGGSATATVNVTVNSINDPPTANDDSASTLRDVPVDIDVLSNDDDIEGDTLSVGSVTQPTNGSVVNNGTNVTYTPSPGYVGGDSFTYTANDGTANGNAATVTVTVSAPGPTTLFSDGFESGNLATGGWTSSGSVAVKEPAAYEGLYGVQIAGTASIAKSVSTVGFSNIHVKYARNTKGLDSGESLTVEWSADGATWNNVIESTQDTAWAQRDIPLGAEAGENAAFSVRFRTNSNRTNEYGFVDSVEITGATAGPDLSAPIPNPMTWATPPYATGTTSISMTATTATDASGVEYSFVCTAGGGHDSGWQDSTSYVDTGLSSGTQYTYTVTARDKSAAQNQTAASTAESATTDSPDSTPPNPDPMTWATAPYSTGETSIAMVATTASDSSGVEYYFTCTVGGGNDSGWQDSTSYEDTGLTADTQYTYTVTTRDKSAAQNQTAASTAESATTNPAPEWTELTYDDFESGWGNYTDGGGDCSLYAAGTYAHQGSRAADIQDNGGTASSFFYTNGVDVHTPGYTQIKVEFWFYAVSMETREDFWLQYYDGSTWRTVKAWASGTDFSNGTFYNPVVYINEAGYTLPTNMKIRFMCDASDNNDDVYIDEVRVSAK